MRHLHITEDLVAWIRNQRLRSSLGETISGSRGTVWSTGFAPSWTKWNKAEIRMTESMSPRARAMLAAKKVAFRVAVAARSFDIRHLAALRARSQWRRVAR